MPAKDAHQAPSGCIYRRRSSLTSTLWRAAPDFAKMKQDGVLTWVESFPTNGSRLKTGISRSASGALSKNGGGGDRRPRLSNGPTQMSPP